jgi:hypothetical protein
MQILANGVSWNDRNPAVNPKKNYDQAIVFLSQPKALPAYYQYNYLDNYDVSIATVAKMHLLFSSS